jgi:hypothetical protein
VLVYLDRFSWCYIGLPPGIRTLDARPGVVIPFRKVAVPRCEGSQIALFPLSPYPFTSFTHTLPSNYLKMSSQASTRRRVQPPARFPKDEIPPVLPVSVPGIRAPADSTPMEAHAVTSLPPDLPQDDKTPSIGPTSPDEGPSVPIARRSLAVTGPNTLGVVFYVLGILV